MTWHTYDSNDPYYMTPLQEAKAEIQVLQDENDMLINQHDKLINALQECLDWFTERQDAEYFTDSPNGVPNEEMKMAWKLKEILK